jgi:hypothetical protein
MLKSFSELIFGQLEHDLHFRASSFVPNLRVQRPKSLAGALLKPGATREQTLEQWSKMSFEDIISQVRGGLARELLSQGLEGQEAPNWLGEFIDGFDRVEYIVNLRLLHALRGIPEHQLRALLTPFLAMTVEDAGLRLDGPRMPGGEAGRRWYHMAQADGYIRGTEEQTLITLEVKACGKTRGTKLDASQIAKHVWLHINEARVAARPLATQLLVVLPKVNGQLVGLASDVVLVEGVLRIAQNWNTTMKKFLDTLDVVDRSEVSAALSELRVPVVSFDALAAAATDANVDRGIGRELERCAETARRADEAP